MSERIMTLFGEEIVPEPVNPAVKIRGKKDREHGEEVLAEVAEPVATEQETGPAEQVTEAEIPAEAEEVAIINDADLDGEKKYRSIGEVAKLLKVNTSHIRFWTNEFGLKVRTTKKGDRLFTRDQIRELKAIYHLVKEKGYTLAGAKVKMKEGKLEVEALDLKQSLVLLRNKLMNIRSRI